MGPNNLPAPSYVEFVARGCQHQVAQLGVDGAAYVSHLQGHKSCLITQEQVALWVFKILWGLGVFGLVVLLLGFFFLSVFCGSCN